MLLCCGLLVTLKRTTKIFLDSELAFVKQPKHILGVGIARVGQRRESLERSFGVAVFEDSHGGIDLFAPTEVIAGRLGAYVGILRNEDSENAQNQYEDAAHLLCRIPVIDWNKTRISVMRKCVNDSLITTGRMQPRRVGRFPLNFSMFRGAPRRRGDVTPRPRYAARSGRLPGRRGSGRGPCCSSPGTRSRGRCRRPRRRRPGRT